MVSWRERNRSAFEEPDMTTLTIELPEGAFSALRRSPPELALEMRIAAAVQWYAEQVVSQEKAAEIAGLTRVEFLDELKRRRVSAFQETLDDLMREIEGD
jgi:predicted HTH domain antitoxin